MVVWGSVVVSFRFFDFLFMLVLLLCLFLVIWLWVLFLCCHFVRNQGLGQIQFLSCYFYSFASVWL